MQGWGADYPAGSNCVTSVGLCQGLSNLSGYCDKALDQRIAAALAQQVTEPGSANDTWTLSTVKWWTPQRPSRSATASGRSS
jgi:hypothetical protein